MSAGGKSLSAWVRSGAPWVWLNASAVSACLLLVLGLLALIAWRGLGHFWPTAIEEWIVVGNDGSQSVLAGQIRESESVSAARLSESGLQVPEGAESVNRILLKTGNRDVTGQDFVWVLEPEVVERSRPANLVVLEREEWGVFIGRLVGLKTGGSLVETRDLWAAFSDSLQRAAALRSDIQELERSRIGSVNYRLERLRLRERGLELDGRLGADAQAAIEAERQELEATYRQLEDELLALNQRIARDSVLVVTADGQERELQLRSVLDAWRPNAMKSHEKLAQYFRKAWAFLAEAPREANTEGGIFPAIYGTVLMVLLMSLFVTPFGVVAAVYLKEYARQGVLTRSIRVAVNNLAGVPSIVYGVFGLGFFIYTIGSSIDELFFREALPAPTFGTGGLFWASLTLALMTLPVVIVSTEEGLARIPRAIREGSLALGATQWETLWRTILPMASPAIMTGMILAVARAAGEVAPLMLVGVVKLAPSLPLDGDYPFLHPERKFMHLGFHIYDVGFQSPNVEAARPLVYATALLLVVVTILLNLVAIRVRNQLREKYRGLET